MSYETRLRTLFWFFIFLLSLWLVGFIYFIFHSPQENCSKSEIDAVIVLTGGKNRIEKAINLFSNINAKKLLISGVGKGVLQKDFEQFSRPYQVSKEDIILGNLAENTLGNAIEAKIFMSLRNYNSLCLVTSHYHLPRSLKIFHETMPETTIYYYPVYSSLHEQEGFMKKLNFYKKVFIEYNKYLIYFVMHFIDNVEIKYYEFLYEKLYDYIPKSKREKNEQEKI